MSEPNFIAGNKNLDFNTAVEAVIKRSCIIDFGIVQSVPANGVVNVAVAVSDTEQNMMYLTCVLANIASSSFTVNVKPNVGDRVLVVYPRMYDEEMFTVHDSETEKKKVIVNSQASGYNLISGIAILINQYKSASHKNVITFENGACTITNEHGTVTLQADGYLSYQQTDDGNNTLFTFSDDGFVMKDKVGNNIVSSHSTTEDAVTINGNLKVKK